MRVIVVGCGRVGSELAVRMQRDGHDVAIIDKNANAFRRLPDEWPGQTVVGFGFDRDVLLQAGIQDADAVAAVTSGDNSNILTARIARETFEITHVVARIKSPRRAVIYQRLGIPTVATVSWTVDQVLRRLLPEEEAVTAWTDPTGGIHIVEHLLPESFCGRAYGELADGERFRPVIITRGGQSRLVGGTRWARRATSFTLPFVPTPWPIWIAGWKTPNGSGGRDRRPSDRKAGAGAGAAHPGRRVAEVIVGIAGGGVVGRSIARDLASSGHQVVIIELDQAVVAREQAEEQMANCVGTRATRARSPPSKTPGSATPTWWWRPPVTTRTIWSCRCWPNRSSPCPE